jgi:hypothetical protein
MSTADSIINTLKRSSEWEDVTKLIGSEIFEDLPEKLT